MKKARILIAAALLLSMCLSVSAESHLSAAVSAAARLAYETDNVTVTGKADFLLDGKRFKTAEITYVQDGENSFWQEKLLTPRDWRPDRESGFTVIQNGWSIYVMETLKPGLYREGSDGRQHTLLRHSPAADLLLALARAAAEQLDPFLGSMITLTEQEDGSRTITMDLREETAPALLSCVASLGMQLAGRRLLGVDSEKWDVYSVDSRTVTQSILYYTKDLKLKNSVLSASLDASGRLTAVSGELNALLISYTGQDLETVADQELTEGGYRAEDRVLTVRFDAEISQYGTSTVKPFDPKDYHVVPLKEWVEPEEKEEELTAEREAFFEQAEVKACKAAGYQTVKYLETALDGGWADVRLDTEGGICWVTLTQDGLLLDLFLPSDFEGGDEMPDYPDELPGEVTQPILDFLRAVNPQLDVAGLMNKGSYGDGKISYVDVDGLTEDGEPTETSLTVRLTPEWRVEEYTCLGGHG